MLEEAEKENSDSNVPYEVDGSGTKDNVILEQVRYIFM